MVQPICIHLWNIMSLFEMMLLSVKTIYRPVWCGAVSWYDQQSNGVRGLMGHDKLFQKEGRTLP